MPVGDINSDANGSGARYNEGKADLSLIPMSTLEDEARVWMYGAKKYSRNNWQKGMVWSVPLGSLLRHLSAWQAGEDNDPETGLPHLAHISCNVRMLTLYAKTYQEGDDRFKGPPATTVTSPAPAPRMSPQPLTGSIVPPFFEPAELPGTIQAVSAPPVVETPAIPLPDTWGAGLRLPGSVPESRGPSIWADETLAISTTPKLRPLPAVPPLTTIPALE